MGGITFVTGVVFGVDPGYRQLALCRSLAGGFVFVSGMVLVTGGLCSVDRFYRRIVPCRSGGTGCRSIGGLLLDNVARRAGTQALPLRVNTI